MDSKPKALEFSIGLDVGGTKLAAILLTADGQIEDKLVTKTYAEEGGEAVLRRLINLADQLMKKAGGRVAGIGVSTPGVVDPNRSVIRFITTDLPGWKDLRVTEVISDRFNLPVRMENDGRAAALAEYRFGVGQGIDDLVTIVLGTGIGGGIVANGQLLRGARGGSGRLGHISVEPNGPLCACGNRGCLELYVSGLALAATAMKALAQGVDSELRQQEKLSQGLSGRDVVEASLSGDALATQVVRESGRRLGQAIVQLIRILDPACIAVGGSVAAAGDLLLNPAREVVAAHNRVALKPELKILPAHFGRDASVVGAAILGWQTAGQLL